MKQLRFLAAPVVCLSLVTVLFIGCGKSGGPERFEVSGKVTFNGEPIADGDITFQPTEGSNAPTASGTIKNGLYKLEGEFGVAAGTYEVRINSYRASAPGDRMLPGGDLDMPPETPGVPSRDQILPEKFNTKSTIEKITLSGKTEKNFDLKE